MKYKSTPLKHKEIEEDLPSCIRLDGRSAIRAGQLGPTQRRRNRPDGRSPMANKWVAQSGAWRAGRGIGSGNARQCFAEAMTCWWLCVRPGHTAPIMVRPHGVVTWHFTAWHSDIANNMLVRGYMVGPRGSDMVPPRNVVVQRTTS